MAPPLTRELKLIPLPDCTEFAANKMARRADDFIADIRRRHTVRDFSARPVPRGLIEKLARLRVHLNRGTMLLDDDVVADGKAEARGRDNAAFIAQGKSRKFREVDRIRLLNSAPNARATIDAEDKLSRDLHRFQIRKDIDEILVAKNILPRRHAFSRPTIGYGCKERMIHLVAVLFPQQTQIDPAFRNDSIRTVAMGACSIEYLPALDEIGFLDAT
ncbi:MAG: hypothetical protein P8Y71_12490 [Pseudolabrys sp.]